MPDITLVLKADNTDVIRKLRQTQQEQQKLFERNKQDYSKVNGLIVQQQRELEKLMRFRLEANDPKLVEGYNLLIDKQIKKLNELENAGRETEKQTQSLTQSMGKWAGAIGVVTAIAAKLVETLRDTVAGMNLMSIAGEVWTQMTYNMVTANDKLNTSLAQSIAIGKQINELRKNDRKDLVDRAKLQAEYNKLYFEASDRTKTDTERIKLLDQALAKHNEMIDLEISGLNQQKAIVLQQIALRPKSNKLLDEETRLNVALLEAESQRYSGTKRIESMITSMKQEQIDKVTKAREDAIKEEASAEVAGHKKAAKQLEQHLKLQSEQKKEWALADGNLLKYIYQQTADAQKEIGKGLVEHDKRLKDEELDRAEEVERAKLELKKKAWQTIIDSEMAIFGIIANMTDRNMQKELETLDKTTQAKISAAKDDAEKINSIEALAALERIEIEKEYAKKQKTIAIAQSLIDTAQSVIKAYMSQVGIPVVGPALATKAAAYAAIFGALQTALITSQKFAKGGWTGKGGMRDETGERIAGIVHEEEFVTKRGPARKYREVLEAINRDDRKMMVNRFTKIMPEVIAPVNNISIDNNGSNNRLDRVNSKLTQISRQLEPRKTTSREVVETGNATIVRRGVNTRTVKR